jgi:hypothetical protein
MADENTNTETATQTETAPDVVTEGSVRHNRQLLNDLKKAQDRLDEYEAAEAKKKGDYDTLLKKEQDKAAKSIKERDEALAAANARMTSLLTDNALKDMIGAYDVKPSLRPALVALLKGQLSVTEDGVMFGDKSPEDFAKAFFASDDGREFLKPVVNSGGGATGNTGTAPATPDAWSLTKYSELKADDPTLAAAYAKKHNKRF